MEGQKLPVQVSLQVPPAVSSPFPSLACTLSVWRSLTQLALPLLLHLLNLVTIVLLYIIIDDYRVETKLNINSHLYIAPPSPSPPRNLRQTTPDNTPSNTIEWDAPVLTGGNVISIATYRITILQVSGYSEEESGTAHTITADGSDVMFNTPYDVEVTAVNTCGLESNPASITVNIAASGEYISTLYFIHNCL